MNHTGGAEPRLEVDSDFNPTGGYVLHFMVGLGDGNWATHYAVDAVAVHGGKDFLNNFELFTFDYILEVEGENLVIAESESADELGKSDKYIITQRGGDFRATDGNDGAFIGNLFDVTNAIRDAAFGENIEIQFGENVALDIGNNVIVIEFTGVFGIQWGNEITLSGSISGNNEAVIVVNPGMNIISKANVENRAESGFGFANLGKLVISGGTNSILINDEKGVLIVEAGTITGLFNQGKATLKGGTIEIINEGFAMLTFGELIFDLDPIVNGMIQIADEGSLTLAEGFAPSADRMYTLFFGQHTAGDIAVYGGAEFIEHFELLLVAFELEVDGDNLVIAEVETQDLDASEKYIIAGSSMAGFRVTDENEGVMFFHNIDEAINAIRKAAQGEDVEIQFGDAGKVLDIGNWWESVVMLENRYDEIWGKITLSGSVTSYSWRTMCVKDDVIVKSSANIANTESNGRAVRIRGTFILDGSPEISGIIFVNNVCANGQLEVSETFQPQKDQIYTLEFSNYENGIIAVANGAMFIENFELTDCCCTSRFTLDVEGDDIVLTRKAIPHTLKLSEKYIITGNDSGFTVSDGDGGTATVTSFDLSDLLFAINQASEGNAIEIQLGDITAGEFDENFALYLGFDMIFDGSSWGKITLTGNVSATRVAIYNSNIVMKSSANIGRRNDDDRAAGTA
jgi:hypothetical protein